MCKWKSLYAAIEVEYISVLDSSKGKINVYGVIRKATNYIHALKAYYFSHLTAELIELDSIRDIFSGKLDVNVIY